MEAVKDGGPLALRDATSTVAHLDDHLGAMVDDGCGDRGGWGGEFRRIVEQIADDLRHADGIDPEQHRLRRQIDCHITLRTSRQSLCRCRDSPADIKLHHLADRLITCGEREEFLDEAAQLIQLRLRCG